MPQRRYSRAILITNGKLARIRRSPASRSPAFHRGGELALGLRVEGGGTFEITAVVVETSGAVQHGISFRDTPALVQALCL